FLQYFCLVTKKKKIDNEEGFFSCSCELCGFGGGSGGIVKPGACSRGSNMQPNRAEPMCGSNHNAGTTVVSMLQEAEGAEAMPLWVPEGP
ncbi:hypothetical protein, partial [Klebsiella pneumoniae]|uniref:hypothetical protein n=1 Tax=Klebsiella pneumoniae TaxID=573 RepID=UPI0037B7DC60